jgi:class 3 adenylate cyclase
LFSDIVGFTTLAASMSTAEVIIMLNQMFTAFDADVDELGVCKVETIGDAYMVVAGHEESSQDDHAQRVLRMAKRMIDRVRDMRLPDGSGLQIRVGIHTGPAYAGVIGTKCPRYCFFGDTVNTSSRMESNGFPMTVHCSESTYHELSMGSDGGGGMGGRRKSQLGEACISLGSRQIKGKGAMTTYLVKYGLWEEALALMKEIPEDKEGSIKSVSTTHSIAASVDTHTNTANAVSSAALVVSEEKLSDMQEQLDDAENEIDKLTDELRKAERDLGRSERELAKSAKALARSEKERAALILQAEEDLENDRDRSDDREARSSLGGHRDMDIVELAKELQQRLQPQLVKHLTSGVSASLSDGVLGELSSQVNQVHDRLVQAQIHAETRREPVPLLTHGDVVDSEHDTRSIRSDRDRNSKKSRGGRSSRRSKSKLSSHSRNNRDHGSGSDSYDDQMRGSDAPMVRQILNKRLSRRGVNEYLVEWEGYSRPTWEPLSSFPDANVVISFERDLALGEAHIRYEAEQREGGYNQGGVTVRNGQVSSPFSAPRGGGRNGNGHFTRNGHSHSRALVPASEAPTVLQPVAVVVRVVDGADSIVTLFPQGPWGEVPITELRSAIHRTVGISPDQQTLLIQPEGEHSDEGRMVIGAHDSAAGSIQEVNSDMFVTVKWKERGSRHTPSVPSPELHSYDARDSYGRSRPPGDSGSTSRLSTGKVKRAVSKVFQREFDEFGDRLMSSVRHASAANNAAAIAHQHSAHSTIPHSSAPTTPQYWGVSPTHAPSQLPAAPSVNVIGRDRDRYRNRDRDRSDVETDHSKRRTDRNSSSSAKNRPKARESRRERSDSSYAGSERRSRKKHRQTSRRNRHSSSSGSSSGSGSD